ncbi:MAG: biopolymer transporter ExbD [Gemmataceae bacterium]
MIRRKAETASKVSLPITPMLDMTFQLLFFFIFNFNPADLEGQMEMALPSQNVTANRDQKKVDKEAKPEKDPLTDIESDLTVKVRTQLDENSAGGISNISVQSISGKEDRVEGLAGLRKYLEEKRKTVTNKEAIKVQGDGKLRIKYILQVMDVCRQAGFNNVSFVPPEGFRG